MVVSMTVGSFGDWRGGGGAVATASLAAMVTSVAGAGAAVTAAGAKVAVVVTVVTVVVLGAQAAVAGATAGAARVRVPLLIGIVCCGKAGGMYGIVAGAYGKAGGGPTVLRMVPLGGGEVDGMYTTELL
mmetsp:Transcript_52328/g.124915  ORF Transcript_52328/g.124915 Transcript_52328/m.124915 type:complete len:129 (+) Transcript_52328:243-629(+)